MSNRMDVLLEQIPQFAAMRVDRVEEEETLPERTLKGKTVFITGASRGIGLAIALRCARDGANIAIAAKTIKPHPDLPGTIFSAAEAVERAGGKALPLQMDVRDEESVRSAMEQAVKRFGGLDILVNNASAISLTNTADLSMKRFDLMHQVNGRGAFMCTKLAIPYLRKSTNPHVINLSPPLNMEPQWFGPHVGYTIAKYCMSMCVLGHADELRHDGIAVNALWPRTTIATAAVQNVIGGDELINMSRKPEVVADAAHCILTRKSTKCTGRFFVDDEVLASEGLANDMEKYHVKPGAPLCPDLFV